MFRSITEFSQAWKNISAGTEKIMSALTDNSLGQEVSPQDRTLGRIAWHIVTTIPEMSGRMGLKLSGPAENTPLPRTAREILEGYQAVSASLVEQIQKNWTDQTLQTEDDMYGQTWKRGLTLNILINHEIHHRGQMTVLMRQAGLKVPGMMGPSREEWSAYGMNPPEI